MMSPREEVGEMERISRHVCPQCGKHFDFQTDLKKHLSNKPECSTWEVLASDEILFGEGHPDRLVRVNTDRD